MAGWRALCVLCVATLLEVSLARRLICWQAMLQCQREADCSYAYNQYTEACSSVLHRPGEAHSAARRRCPSHCISALIQLNHTKDGPALEDCDCAMDEICKATKRAIEPCMPRTSTNMGGAGGGAAAAAAGGGGGGGGGGSSAAGGAVMGCMEARRLCENDRRCHSSLTSYLHQCGRLFNGVRCTDECRAVIEDMMRVPKALLLNDCVCDGMERPICESIKENMARLCFGAEMGNGGPGSSGGSDYDYYDEYEDDPAPGKDVSYEEEPPRVNTNASSAGGPGAAPTLTFWTSIVLMLLLLG